MKKIAVFVGRSLLTQGLLAYLNSCPDKADICALDIFSDNLLQQIKTIKPDVVFVESHYLSQMPDFSLLAVLELFPHLTIFELNLDSPIIKIFHCEERTMENLQELVSMIDTGNKLLPHSISVRSIENKNA
ncbi:MAG: hypothetical protein HZB50_16500 [Chloroflexi bacterium]|nr:hypothetical protein [Chloroflexota bacterium]